METLFTSKIWIVVVILIGVVGLVCVITNTATHKTVEVQSVTPRVTPPIGNASDQNYYQQTPVKVGGGKRY